MVGAGNVGTAGSMRTAAAGGCLATRWHVPNRRSCEEVGWFWCRAASTREQGSCREQVQDARRTTVGRGEKRLGKQWKEMRDDKGGRKGRRGKGWEEEGVVEVVMVMVEVSGLAAVLVEV